MISVEDAEKAILAQVRDFGSERLPFAKAWGRVLAQDLKADRDIPAYNRVAMDGIAITYEAFERGVRSFAIKGIQAAGDTPVEVSKPEECVEIMTGAALPASADTVIRYEDLEIKDGFAAVQISNVRKGQNVHTRGKDKKEGEAVAYANQLITPALAGIAAATGAAELLVRKLPLVALVTTGDELVEVHETPAPYQIRKSNNYSIAAALEQYHLHADNLHVPDNLEMTLSAMQDCLQRYDVILLSGGVSAGKFDYVPQALERLSVKKLFHKVEQRPGKPFWFGVHESDTLVFAFPGNPVSTFMCLYRYFLPWLRACLNLPEKKYYAVLDKEIAFAPSLQYFLQVRAAVNEEGKMVASPVEGNGSGDFAHLLEADAFMELPATQSVYARGDVFRIWPVKGLCL